jgi:hypothetical protein
MGAAYLGFFFILSHIFEDAKALSSKDKRVDWAEHQIESSSNLCGWKLAYVAVALSNSRAFSMIACIWVVTTV